METAEIRRRFLAHFENAGHTVVPSAPLLFDDPNLLFVNAGMVPFKPYFLQQETPPFDRAVSVQKCVRTLDIEEVGKTTRHGTFFQMNGNFSFGDYFKEGAIEHAWNLVTGSLDDGGYGFEPDSIWVTVLEGDDEARQIWKDIIGLPDERIQSRGLLDNYWHMGVPGPGGPCSEIYVDRGAEFGPDGGPVVDEDRFLEIWNLVFMQEEITNVRAKDQFDVVGPLPSQNIDTGMGLERVAYLLQDKHNLYDIDEVFPVIEKASELSGRRYGADHDDDVRFRVIADHVRSGLMLIGDGVTPGNEARGYVLRRLLRRAVRSMRLLGYDDPALPELLPVSLGRMKASYPELERDFARISQIAYAEEEAFRQTLDKGTQIFDLAAASTQQQGGTQLSGERAFALHDTYGFPIDLTLEMASEQGLSVDEDGFRALMEEQRARAKADAKSKKGQHADTSVYRAALDTHGPTDWQAYTTLSTESRVLGLLAEGAAVPALTAGTIGEVVLDRTPFYAESGGQNADAGTISWDGGSLVEGRPRCSTCSARSAASSSTRSGCSRASSPSTRPSRHRSTPSGVSAHARPTPAPTSCTPRSARCSAPPRCSPAPTTGRATCGSTSGGPGACRRSSSATSRRSPTAPCARTSRCPPRSCPSTAPRRSVRWPCSARRTARTCESWRSAARGRASSVAAPTSSARRRSAPSCSPPTARWVRATVASRRSSGSRDSATSPASVISSSSSARC